MLRVQNCVYFCNVFCWRATIEWTKTHNDEESTWQAHIDKLQIPQEMWVRAHTQYELQKKQNKRFESERISLFCKFCCMGRLTQILRYLFAAFFCCATHWFFFIECYINKLRKKCLLKEKNSRKKLLICLHISLTYSFNRWLYGHKKKTRRKTNFLCAFSYFKCLFI